jgi:hypothetical protein
LVSNIEGKTLAEAFENRALRNTFGPKMNEVTESGEDYTMRIPLQHFSLKTLFEFENKSGKWTFNFIGYHYYHLYLP